jgi:hypothetical protein
MERSREKETFERETQQIHRKEKKTQTGKERGQGHF